MKRTSNSKIKKILRSRLGMTYVELLTALGLLALIITAFTPMLLSSNETLYDAGVKVQDVYDSKQEIEEGLARRDSESAAAVKLNMRVNADALFEQVNVSGRKIISTFREGLETVFGQIRARIEIVSPSTVYDNATNHTIVLQTFGMEYSKITFGAFNYDTTNEPGAANKMPADQIHIQVIAPNKAAKKSSGTADENMIGTEDELVYSSGRFCEVEYYSSKFNTKPVTAAGLEVSNDTDAGRIKLKIKSPASGDKIDFTYSPLKVKVYYINNRGNLATVSDYLYIEPATLLMAGETASTIDYYTSAGIEAVDVSESDDPDDKAIEYQLKAEARVMRTSNSAYLYNAGQYDSAIGAPRQTNSEIRSIRWIDNDETQGLNPYYVMTGTNGSIYRMYSFTSDKSDIFSEALGASIYDTSTGFFNATQDYIDRVYTTDTGKRVYPALWGGDYSHIFEYTTSEQRVAYGSSANYNNDQAWVTSAQENGLDRAGLSGDPAYNVMSANAKFCYYYNGDGTNHKYAYKNGKPISYILTERGWPIRLIGIIGPADPDEDYFEDFTALWDKNNTVANIRSETIYSDSSQVLAFHYKYKNTDGWQDDYVYGALRIKSLASYPITNANKGQTSDYFDTAEDYENTTSQSKIKNVQKTKNDVLNGSANDVNVTDVIYIPGTDTTQGSTFYVGNVHGYANIIQTTKIEAGAAQHKQWENAKYETHEKHLWTYWEDHDIDPIEASNLVGQRYDTLNGVSVPAAINMVGRYYRNSSKGLIDTDNACSYPKGMVVDYLILSNQDGTATYVAKYNENDYSRMGADDRRTQFEGISSFVSTYDKTISASVPGSDGKITVASQPIYYGSTLKTRTTFFLPTMGANWEYLYLGDVSFTFGYASNRERVYTNITYDGEVEYTRSFERLYWRSHYGQDATYYKEDGELNFVEFKANQDAYSGSELAIHQQNRAVSNGSGGLQTSQTYLNSVDNDYYNVWFPGEMYNLNKIASKDGVTVAVGYAVVGSSYQHAMSSDSSVTSTALGSIYNDGVLAAMIEGKDDAFINLLYYKDNETFDNYSLYSATNANGGTYGQYAEYGSVGYGMHGRDSVQFTAVDLLVENIKASETAKDYTVNYYAYYGDNKGRVFRSLVASASGTGSGAEGEMNAAEAGASLVPYISDTSIMAMGTGNNTPSQMTEIALDNGATLDTYFSKIVTIDAMDDLIIITGEMRNGGQEYFVVGVRDANTGNMSWRLVSNCGFTSIINDATIVGGYYYIVGDGWLAGVSLDVLRDTSVTALSTPSLTSAALGCKSSDPNQLLWCETSVKLYAIAGRDTQ